MSPRVTRITRTPRPKGFSARKECEAGHHYAEGLYSGEELDELGEAIREARAGKEAGHEH